MGTLWKEESSKYLGLKYMTWEKHVHNIANKVNKTLGFLKRNLKISSPKIKDKAYKALVRPVLENASPMWDPHSQKSKQKGSTICAL